MKKFFIYLILLFILLQNLVADDIDSIAKKIALINANKGNTESFIILNDLYRLEYQKQILKLTDDVANTDTAHKELVVKVTNIDNIYKTILNNQQVIYKTQLEKLQKDFILTLNSQKENFEYALDNQKQFYQTIGGIFITLILLLTFVGYTSIQKYILKRVNKKVQEKIDEIQEDIEVNISNNLNNYQSINEENRNTENKNVFNRRS
jgi:hypothetical protein